MSQVKFSKNSNQYHGQKSLKKCRGNFQKLPGNMIIRQKSRLKKHVRRRPERKNSPWDEIKGNFCLFVFSHELNSEILPAAIQPLLEVI